MDKNKKKRNISKSLSRFRGWVQAGATLLTNVHLPNFFKGGIYQGNGKAVCVPGLNCYSCPAASGACPIGSFQSVVGSSKFKFSYYNGIFNSARRTARSLYLWISVSVRMASGFIAQNTDKKAVHKKAETAYLFEICNLTAKRGYTACICSK